jgi:hypothetical protein
MEAGDTVRWWTKDGGWRFGRLASITGQTARVNLGDAVRRVPLADLKTWPPERAAADDDTTPRQRVRRGR